MKKTRTKSPPVKGTTLGDYKPTPSELVDEYLVELRRRKDALFAEFIAECRRDPRFLEKALKELKPLREAGSTKRLPHVVEHIMAALKGHRPKDIVDTIAVTEKLSVTQARRLYDAARNRKRRK